MITFNVEKPLLLASMGFNDQRNPKLILEMIIDLIDNHFGTIYGSTMTAYMLRSPVMNGYYPNDIDVLFKNSADYEGFISKIKSTYFSPAVNGSTVNMNEYHPYNPYLFSNMIERNNDKPVETILSIYWIQQDWRQCINLHLIHLKDGCINNNERTYEYIEKLFNGFFQFDFTKTLYYQEKVWSFTADRPMKTKMSIPIHQISNKSAMSMIQKYTKFGFTFDIVNSSIETRIDRKVLHEAKAKYRNLGLVVIPLCTKDSQAAGKAPMVYKWSEKTIKYDFNVDNCDNIGIVCGKESGIICIDVDEKNNGMMYFDKLIQLYGLPKCPIQETPNNGRHYIFKYNPKRMSKMKARIKGVSVDGEPVGIDMWISKCQFVVEPSVNHSNNRPYKWITPIVSKDDIPELPEWIYDLYHHEKITKDGIIENPKINAISDVKTEGSETASEGSETASEGSEIESEGSETTKCSSEYINNIFNNANWINSFSIPDHPKKLWMLIPIIIAFIMIIQMIFTIIVALIIVWFFLPENIRKIILSYFK